MYNPWFWIDAAIVAFGSIAFLLGIASCANLEENNLTEIAPLNHSLIPLVMAYGGGGLTIWRTWGYITGGWRSIVLFGLAVFVLIVLVELTALAFLTAPELIAQRRCVKNGGHYFKRQPLIPEIAYEEVCDCGKRGKVGPYVLPGDPEWGWD